MAITTTTARPLRLRARARPRSECLDTPNAPNSGPPQPEPPQPRRMARNFAALSLAEIVCRAISVVVMLTLARRLGTDAQGKVEFAFNIVFWLVLLVRDGLEIIAAREIARHPRLIRHLVNHVLAVKLMLATALFTALGVINWATLSGPAERAVLALYGLMLFTTALGLDFVYRGLERMGLVAASLTIRTATYAVGVLLLVTSPSRIVWVPACLVVGEACGIALVWAAYIRAYGWPKPALGRQSLRVLLRRGRPVYAIQVSSAVIGSADLLVVGLLSGWADVGIYSVPHRMAGAVLTFGLIVQQVIFPALARSWRDAPDAGRRALDASVRFLMMGLVPLAVGATTLAVPLVDVLNLPAAYDDAALLLALGVWRAPLLTLAFLYQTALIAVGRESAGVKLLAGGAIAAAPLAAALRLAWGLPGAAAAVVLVAFTLVVAGYRLLAREGRQPAWHHHLARPLLASAVMVPACLFLQRWHVVAAVAGGAAVYGLALVALGGLRPGDPRTLLGRSWD